MQTRTKGWAVVWAIIGLAGIFSYPTGESTLLFGFWPSNHFIMWFLTLLVGVVGVIYAYDMLYNIYPNSEKYDDLEIAEEGGIE
jgi:formate hydrogenlyase subunit 3/multisubunit Na+/H+ antiporter MnhD subunit